MVSFLGRTDFRGVRYRLTDKQTDPTTVPSLRMPAEGNKERHRVLNERGVVIRDSGAIARRVVRREAAVFRNIDGKQTHA